MHNMKKNIQHVPDKNTITTEARHVLGKKQWEEKAVLISFST